ncbi:MAG: hypothetical protein ABFD96_16555 [Armatimonadia bacterium]
MPRFHFPLQQLLDLKTNAEKRSRSELVATERALSLERVRLDELSRSCDQALQVTAAVPGHPVETDLLLNNSLHLARLRLRMAAQQARVQQCSDLEEARRYEHGRLSRERQVVERLKERRHEEFRERVAHAETSALDEAAMIVFTRQKTEWQSSSTTE